MSFFRKYEEVNKKLIANEVKNCQVGSIIQIKFIDPANIGLSDPSNQLSKRFDVEDLVKRIILGTLIAKKNMLGIDFIEISSTKINPVYGKYERVYTIMADEIEEFKVLAI